MNDKVLKHQTPMKMNSNGGNGGFSVNHLRFAENGVRSQKKLSLPTEEIA